MNVDTPIKETLTILGRYLDATSVRLYHLKYRRCPVSATLAFKEVEAALFNPDSGRLDAARIAKEMGVPVATIAGAIGRKAPGVRKSPDASSIQQSLRKLYRVWVTLVDLYAGDRMHARIFLNAPNRHLENRAPIEFIEKGDLTPLEMYVSTMGARQPT
jgi:uncharacterized protein (DUF2384 family)